MIMRKLIILCLMAAVLVPAAASAQSRGEIRHDRRDVRHERRDVRGARQELREDRRDFRGGEWRDYRARNRAIYARGNWHAPFRYRAFRPGIRIGAVYYGPRYRIADPWRYHLPRAFGYQRWVRHYDDALLVDVRRGIVLQVIHNFYW
jgi:Ni/Co efflux regulator RcnB